MVINIPMSEMFAMLNSLLLYMVLYSYINYKLTVLTTL